MKLGITAKLFLAILAACVAVLLINGLAVQAFVKRQFLDYLNEQGVERMLEALPRVRAEYARHGNWDFARDNPDVWFVLMRPERGSGPPRRAPPISDQTGAVFRFALLDQDYTPVIGNPDVGRDDILRPVVVGGRTVGWMAMLPFQKALAGADARFYAAQQRAWWTIGSASLVVAALLGWLMSRALLRRMRGLAGATHRLAAGDYATRIDAGARDELGQLARDFNLLAQALEHNERARREFMADISHELRTPLAVLRAELEALQDGIRSMTPDSLGSLHQQVGQLGKLIEDLYDVSLTDVGALAYRRAPVDLALILATVLAGVQARFAAAQLQLQVQIDAGPLQVDGDERRLQQLLGNLLENTLRYTDAGGTVRVRCARRDAALELVVEDSAPGVDADKRERLFERFYRTEASRNRASGGSGLGLAICRNIAEAHGGSIHAEASALGGLRMVLRLPALVA
ncbi:sensor histidine kinase efflux regulator BaeS [Xanthomonas citri pv. malvacearum]|uniref:sensor histidine kinase efflux regulator BaeS n=1 Tax=Xanthomonas citri TaxID=346 RepID=UPI0022AF8652|nr:sensor histidine kinase efflux regulator BaeS [Xanthomonas citri]WAW90946.1 sensor histidine kinase efflux regulator BaeS [Xanthomonas citri pv. malvacearum]